MCDTNATFEEIRSDNGDGRFIIVQRSDDTFYPVEIGKDPELVKGCGFLQIVENLNQQAATARGEGVDVEAFRNGRAYLTMPNPTSVCYVVTRLYNSGPCEVCDVYIFPDNQHDRPSLPNSDTIEEARESARKSRRNQR
ncbi:hypothetical protein [Gluconobacter albidus]|uniref:hypothetical protein n=1 Tax=Gluconobacter albidus TaxID=318683 RepID=UPI0012E84EB1|nr:hypothetical protein [Gluconobacter albidus]